MGVREGGSYVADKAGTETLVERTKQGDAVPVVETGPAPEVMSAPAAPIVEPADDQSASSRRRGGSDSKPQE